MPSGNWGKVVTLFAVNIIYISIFLLNIPFVCTFVILCINFIVRYTIQKSEKFDSQYNSHFDNHTHISVFGKEKMTQNITMEKVARLQVGS